MNVVREMYGLLAHHNADQVVIAALGGFTPDAARFASGKPIELIDGAALLAMIRAVQGATNTASSDQSPLPTPAAEVPSCPKCGTTMVRRNNRRDGTQFWGCRQFPACRGTR